MISHRRSLAFPSAVALTAAMVLTLPCCQGRRRAPSSTKARESDQHEFAISISGDPGVPFLGSYRVIRSDSTSLQPVDGLTPARIRVRGVVVSAEIQKRQAGGKLEVRILREGCNPALGPCVEIDGILYRTVALSRTVEPYGVVLVSSASAAPSRTIPQRHRTGRSGLPGPD
jgi:hypothetical protein